MSAGTLMEKKIEVYADFIGIFSDFTNPKIQKQVKLNPKKQEDLGIRMVEIGVRMSLFAGIDVLKKYVEFRLLSQGGGNSDEVIDCFSRIVLAMRDDLESGSSEGLTSDNILGSFLITDGSELLNSKKV